ncbi:hypothetical protein QFZ27_001689 [Inquilinus ginsengisoli]|uniref:hypothetical protein n=1 Tax=Inquilinus ginsengisoli TaxID=363840 RepID=UPI003D20B9B3
MTPHAIEETGRGRWTRLRFILVHEFRKLLPPTIFFFVGFNLILFSKRLLLADYLIQFSGFFLATTAALVVGKVVLIADTMPFLRRFDRAPLAQPILFKTVVYSLLVSAVRLLEAFAHYLIGGGSLGGGGFLNELLGSFSWDHFIVTQIWILVLFLVYVTASEINGLIGDGELFKILFTRRSSELKLTRRARIRLLARLSRLADPHSIDVLRDPKTTPHAELVAILRSLGHRGRPG